MAEKKNLGKSDQVRELSQYNKCGGEGNGDGFEDAGKGNPHKETSALVGCDYTALHAKKARIKLVSFERSFDGDSEKYRFCISG